MSQSQLTQLHNKSVLMVFHWTIHYLWWYLHTYASFPMRMYEYGHEAQPCTRTPSQIPDIPQVMHNTAYLLPTTKTKDQVQSGLLLDVVVTQRTAILQLLTSKDQSLLVRWDTLLVLDL